VGPRVQSTRAPAAPPTQLDAGALHLCRTLLDAIDGATKSLLSELDSLSRACMDVTRQEQDTIDEGDQNTEGPGDDL
jgi:hypothetical protein